MTDPLSPIDIFSRLLRMAAKQVPDLYFQLPRIEQDTTTRPCFQERVYCYELYHQMRVLMENDAVTRCAVDDRWCLNAELDKKGSYIDSEEVPDFIWHKPGTVVNGCVVEVKRAVSRPGVIASDVEKLVSFREAGDYAHAILLIIGEHGQRRRSWRPVDDAVVAAGGQVEVLYHQKAGATPTSKYVDEQRVL